MKRKGEDPVEERKFEQQPPAAGSQGREKVPRAKVVTEQTKKKPCTKTPKAVQLQVDDGSDGAGGTSPTTQGPRNRTVQKPTRKGRPNGIKMDQKTYTNHITWKN